MDFKDKVFQDIKSGRNLDIYIYLPVGIGIIIVDLFTEVPASVYYGIVLAGISIIILSTSCIMFH